MISHLRNHFSSAKFSTSFDVNQIDPNTTHLFERPQMTAVTLTLSFNTTAEAAAFLAGTTPSQGTTIVETAKPQETTSAPKSEKKSTKDTAKKQETPATASPTATEEAGAASSSSESSSADRVDASSDASSDTKEYTYEDVKAALMAYSQKVNREIFAALLAKHGVAKVPALAEKPEAFAAIIAETEAA